MDKVFEIYLAKQDQPENGAYAEVSFPATAYQMQDAFDKLRLAEGEQPYWEITEYHKFEELSTILNDTCGLNDLNALAQRLSELDERQCTAFAGLLAIERESGVLVERTVDHPGGYAEQRDELRQVYKTLDLTPKKPRIPSWRKRATMAAGWSFRIRRTCPWGRSRCAAWTARYRSSSGWPVEWKL